jgi:hypothetical protein
LPEGDMTTPIGEYEDFKGRKQIIYKLGHEADAIYKAWDSDQASPNLITCFHDKEGLTFLMSYEVRIDEWRYIVQSHVHVRDKLIGGGTWISGAGPKCDTKTPAWVVKQAPTDKDAYKTGWASDTTYQTKLYTGDYRKPTDLLK